MTGIERDHFQILAERRIGTYQIFQETYHPPTYKKMHPRGPKSDYEYRLDTPSRAMSAGIDDIGIGALFPGSHELSGFWRDIVAGRDLISDIPTHYWLTDDFYSEDFFEQDKTYAKRGAFLDPIDFDSMGFGVPPNIMPETDTSQLLALIVAQQVLDDAAVFAILSTARTIH